MQLIYTYTNKPMYKYICMYVQRCKDSDASYEIIWIVCT